LYNKRASGSEIVASESLERSAAPTLITDRLDVAADANSPGCSYTIQNASSNGCGFSLTSTWLACSNGYNNNVWVSPRTTLSNAATVNNSTIVFQPGTELH
jgi:hypothetical protein